MRGYVSNIKKHKSYKLIWDVVEGMLNMRYIVTNIQY